MTGGELVDVLVLGPVGLRRGEEFLSPPSGVARAVVAALAVAGSDGLTSAALFETVWGSRSASAERSTVTVSVHRVRQWLRQTVGDAARIDRLGAGYVLRMTGESDVARFLRLSAGDVEQQAAALALWRGRALADVPGDSQDAVAVGDLVRGRLECATACAEAYVRRGAPEQAIHALNPLVDEHPLDERLQASWMLALAASGRQAEALEVYERVRRQLRSELGVDPGAVLTECLLKILRGEIATANRTPRSISVVPAQLPANVATFTGRTEQLKSLDELAAPVRVVCGPGGVGKTSLAVQWAYRSLADHPDGQLFVDLRGYSREAPVPVIEVLHRFVRALGCPPDEIPADRDEAAALYRSMLADRRVLVVLDNALSADQVRPLLPGAGQCTVVVTSRDRLDGLTVRDGARRLDLDVLTPSEARALLAEAIGGRTTDLDALARACGYLPLALRVAAAQIRRSPTIADYLAEMQEIGPLNALSVEGDEQATVAAAFDLSYARVPAEAQRCYRLLALVPGPDVPAAAVAALIGESVAQARQQLRVLTGVHLVNGQSNRFSMHDLLKAHARSYLDEEESSADKEAAAQRLFDWYLASACKASDLIYAMTRLPDTVPPAVDGLTDFAGPEAAANWFQDELTNIMYLLRSAESLGVRRTWLLVDAMRGYLAYHRAVPEWASACAEGLAAAERAANLAGQAAMHHSVGGIAYYVTHDIDSADDAFRRAAEFADLAGWVQGKATVLRSRSLVDEIRGDLDQWIAKLTKSIRMTRAEKLGTPEIIARNNLAFAYLNQGRIRQAISQMTWILEDSAGSVQKPLELLLENRGDAYRQFGAFRLALKDLERAVEASRAVVSRFHEARSLATLSTTFTDGGRPHTGLAVARMARLVTTEMQDGRLGDDVSLALGRAYHALGDDRRAAMEYQHVLRDRERIVNFATRVSAMLGVASVLREPAVVREVLDLLAGRSYRPLEGQAYGLLADFHLENNRVADAIGAAERAVEVYAMTDNRPGKVAVLQILAEAYRRAGRDDDAAVCEERAGKIRAELRPLSLPAQ